MKRWRKVRPKKVEAFIEEEKKNWTESETVEESPYEKSGGMYRRREEKLDVYGVV